MQMHFLTFCRRALIIPVFALAVATTVEAQVDTKSSRDFVMNTAAQQQVLLRFQLIEATTASLPRDAAIAEVDTVLRDLFRFNGYRLLSQAILSLPVPASRGVGSGSSSRTGAQLLSGLGGRTYELSVTVNHSWSQGTSDALMTADVALYDVSPPDSNATSPGARMGRNRLLSTSVSIAAGRTVVLGSTQPAGPGSALILAVRPQIR